MTAVVAVISRTLVEMQQTFRNRHDPRVEHLPTSVREAARQGREAANVKKMTLGN